MKKIAAICLMALCSLTLSAQKQATPPPASDDYTLSVNVDLVLFNVAVTDKKGRFISGLAEKNFHIVEDGKPQEIRQFHAEDNPATVGLVIDNSGSMVAKRADVIETAFQFVGESNPKDELFVVNFNDHVSMGLPESTPFAGNSPVLRNALMHVKADGKTALYDGIATGLGHLEKGTYQKKALVVLSDGGDNASKNRLQDVLDMAQKSSATIYTIGIFDQYDRDKNTKVLRQIAKLTGGQSFILYDVDNLVKVWNQIAGGIRSQYTVGYISTNPNRDGVFRNVKISVDGVDGKPLEVRTRKGYVGGQ